MSDILKDYLESAQTALRDRVEQAKASGEKAANLLALNGSRDMLPDGKVHAIETVRKAYQDANSMAERVLGEQLKASRAKVPPPPPMEEEG